MKGKATHTLSPASEGRQAKSVLGLTHSDLWGPSPVTSIDRTHYVLTLTDNRSQWLWVIFLKSKSEAFKVFINWLTYVDKETGLKLYMIHTDNGGEYLSQLWNKFLKECSIHHELTSPYTSKQNRVSECQNCTIFDHICTILIDSGLPLFYLPKAIKYMKNRHVTWSLNNMTPFKIHYRKKPNINNLHPSSCKAYVYNHSPKWNKLEPQAKVGIFVEYSNTQKAYQICFLGKWLIVNSNHVKFNTSNMMGGQFQAEEEEQFHYSSLKSTVLAPKTPEIILDKPTPPIPHHSPSILKQSLLDNAPDLPLTLLPPNSITCNQYPGSHGTSRALNAGGVSTPTLQYWQHQLMDPISDISK